MSHTLVTLLILAPWEGGGPSGRAAVDVGGVGACPPPASTAPNSTGKKSLLCGVVGQLCCSGLGKLSPDDSEGWVKGL